jgi:hypothetical protein
LRLGTATAEEYEKLADSFMIDLCVSERWNAAGEMVTWVVSTQ